MVVVIEDLDQALLFTAQQDVEIQMARKYPAVVFVWVQKMKAIPLKTVSQIN
jgi:hypothetical protein